MNNCNRLYFLCGNARTFETCFDNAYENIIDKLFDNNTPNNTYVLLYLKSNDPGPKGQNGWDFKYPNIKKEKLQEIVSNFKNKYKNVKFYSELLITDEISDIEIFKQIKNRSLYKGFFGDDKKLIRGLHFHYNIERCGNIINRIEENLKLKFDFYIHLRPDLYFKNYIHNISNYDYNKIIVGGQKDPCDHLAIIPNKYKYDFFFARMNLFRTNNEQIFYFSEMIYFHTIRNKFYRENLGDYFIKRE